MTIVLAFLACLQEQEEKKDSPRSPQDIEVTSTRLEVPLKETPTATTVLDAERIGLEHRDTPVELLRGLPGFHITRTGTGRNGLASMFTRGTNSNHTLVMVDGFQITRDGGQFFEYDILTAENLDRVEAMRGAASAVYGSDAVGGALNFITRRGEGPAAVRLSAEGGTFGTSRGLFEVSGGSKEVGYSVSLSRFEQADGTYGNSDFEDFAFAGRLDYRLGERTSMKIIARYVSADVQVFTNGPPKFVPKDPNAKREDDLLLLGGEFTHWALDWLELVFRVSRLETERFSSDPLDPSDSFGPSHSVTNFDRDLVELRANAHLKEWGVLTAGAEYEIEEVQDFNAFGFNADQERFNRAVYGQWSVKAGDRLTFVPGVRSEDNEAFGTDTNARVGAAYLHRETSTKLRASAGTGILEPSLSQNFGFGGNPDLEPEQSVTWDAGLDQWLLEDKLRVGVTYFETRLRDMILFNFTTFQFFNGGDGVTRGIEAEAEYSFLGHAVAGATYTFLRTRATDVDEPLAAPTLVVHEPFIRRPTHAGRVYAGYHVPDSYGLFATVSVIGGREDASFVAGRPPRERADGFVKTDLSGYLVVADNLRLVGRVDNLFDVAYEEVIGFPGPHASFLIGLEYTLKP